MVAVANTKIMLRPIRRILSAISFGVFCRSAPSTSLIMRSINVEPCAAVMRTRIQSESTCVPPVTADLSPPNSRMTGANSPVIAASLTEATPSMISPVRRNYVTGLDQNDVADLQIGAGNELEVLGSRGSKQLGLRLRALLPEQIGLRLPRPSATASAKFANSTVNQSHSTIWNVKPRLAPPVRKSRTRMIVVADDLKYEHHQILDQRTRVELDERRSNGRQDDLHGLLDPKIVLRRLDRRSSSSTRVRWSKIR